MEGKHDSLPEAAFYMVSLTNESSHLDVLPILTFFLKIFSLGWRYR